MNNITLRIKGFLTNKNTVTILALIICILVLWWGYNYRINQKTNPTPVPYAKENIPPRTLITSDMVGMADVPMAMIKGAVITDPAKIINKYSRENTAIPEGSLFYQSAVVDKEDLQDSIIYDYPADEGYTLVNLSVTTDTTYGNKMYPGNYIDIYIKAVNRIDEENMTSATEDKIMVGKLIKNVKILATLDSNGEDVFEDLDNVKTPSQLIFAVPEEYHILLRKAMYLRTYEVTIIPVPTNESLKKEPGEVSISNEKLKDFINRVTEFTDADIEENTPIPTTPAQ